MPQDYTEALKWFRLAAEQGFDRAQYILGVMYSDGLGVPQDDVEAVKWDRLAVEQGYAPAQYNLGLMYLLGRGVSQDYVQAHMWFNLAASRSPPGEDHDKAVKGRGMVAGGMTPAQIAEAEKLAQEWQAKNRK